MQETKSCRAVCRGVALLVVLALPSIALPEEGLQVVLAIDGEGKASEQWLRMIRSRSGGGSKGAQRKLSEEERKWAELIRSRASAWRGRLDVLAAPFAGTRPPERVLIVLGNGGRHDAFTYDPMTIGFDLSVLQALYGSSTQPPNPGRIDRFFDHEYTHLLQKAWLADHPYPADTPLREALLDIWLEGLGNYRSLSDRWRARNGEASRDGSETLSVLEPRFVARLSALACADRAVAAELLKGLSDGPFEQKWGALPAALWLEGEASVDPSALRRFVASGPEGVWDLAASHVPPALKAVLAEARSAGRICASGRP